MAIWADLEREAPEIAAAGRRLLPEVAFLATVSPAGRPRVHPFCPAIANGRLWAFVIEESPKRRDLDVNGEFAVHALPGPEDEQFFVAGRAARVADPDLRRAALAAMPYDDADAHHLLYELLPERALWTTWENFQRPGMRPLHRVWRARDSAAPRQSPIAKLDPSRPPLRWLVRLPLLLYRAHLGWLLGERFVELTIRGRKSGLPRQVVLEVVRRDPGSGGLVVASAWGRRAQWFRNLEADPRARVRVGRREFAAAVSVLDDAAAAQSLREYALTHRLAYRWFIAPLLRGPRPAGEADEFRALVRSVPLLLVQSLEEAERRPS